MSSDARFVQSLEPRQLFAVPADVVLATGRLNFDNADDIVYVSGRNSETTPPKLMLLLSQTKKGKGDGKDGTVNYAPPQQIFYRRAGSITSIAIADIDGDKDNDLIIASNGKLPGLTGGLRNKRARIQVLLGVGQTPGVFESLKPIQLGGIQEALEINIARVDDDFISDIVIGARSRVNFASKKTEDSIYVLLGKGGGDFDLPTRLGSL